MMVLYKPKRKVLQELQTKIDSYNCLWYEFNLRLTPNLHFSFYDHARFSSNRILRS